MRPDAQKFLLFDTFTTPPWDCQGLLAWKRDVYGTVVRRPVPRCYSPRFSASRTRAANSGGAAAPSSSSLRTSAHALSYSFNS